MPWPKNKVYSCSDEEFEEIIKNNYSYKQVGYALGYKGVGTYIYTLVKRRCKELNISTDHFQYKPDKTNKNGGGIKYTLEEILVEDSPYISTCRFKKRLLNSGLLEYKCSVCGNTGEWQGKELVLQLHHINGKRDDNRLENLTLLCPNCHSQTDNFAARNNKKKDE